MDEAETSEEKTATKAAKRAKKVAATEAEPEVKTQSLSVDETQISAEPPTQVVVEGRCLGRRELLQGAGLEWFNVDMVFRVRVASR